MASRSSPRNHQDSTIYEEKVTQKGEHYFHPYYIGRLLGRGGFATCYEVKAANDSTKYAIKIIPKDEDPQKRLDVIAKIREEVVILKSLNHHGVVKYYNDFQDRHNFYIIMELCTGGSLSDIMKKRRTLTEPEVRYFVVQMADIMRYIKSKKIIHRDIKLANYFLDDKYRLKLGDFGLATDDNSFKNRKRFCGTPNYIAPEIVERKSYGFEVDAWSTGVLLKQCRFTMLFGKPPFQTKNCKETYEKIKTCTYEFPKSSNCSEPMKDFIRRLLCLSPVDRLKFEDFMSHPFIYNFDIPKQLEESFGTSPPSRVFTRKYNKAIRDKKIEVVNVQPIIPATPQKSIKKTSAKQMPPASKAQRRVTYKNVLKTDAERQKEISCVQVDDEEPVVKVQENICKQEDQQPALQLDAIKKQECLAELPQTPIIGECEKSVQKKEEPEYGEQDHDSSTNLNGRKKFQPNNPVPAPDIEKTAKKAKKEQKLVLFAAVEQKNDDEWVRPKLKLKFKQATSSKEERQVRIVYWQQCSNQFAIAYVLTNHQIGMYFEDSTCMHISRDNIIHYFVRDGAQFIQKEIKASEVEFWRETETHLFAKAKILLHHDRVLRGKYPLKEEKIETTLGSMNDSSRPRALTWLKTVNRGDKIIAFTLNTGNIQFQFDDQTTMFFSLSSYTLSYRVGTQVTIHNIPLASKSMQGDFGEKVKVVLNHYNKVLNLRSGEGSERWLLQQDKRKQAPKKKQL